MLTIWKFPLAITDEQEIVIPFAPRWLSCQVQDGDLCLWALVHDTYAKTKHKIRIVGTGHPLGHHQEDLGKHLGTVQMGQFVWHVFDLGEVPGTRGRVG